MASTMKRMREFRRPKTQRKKSLVLKTTFFNSCCGKMWKKSAIQVLFAYIDKFPLIRSVKTTPFFIVLPRNWFFFSNQKGLPNSIIFNVSKKFGWSFGSFFRSILLMPKFVAVRNPAELANTSLWGARGFEAKIFGGAPMRSIERLPSIRGCCSSSSSSSASSSGSHFPQICP